MTGPLISQCFFSDTCGKICYLIHQYLSTIYTYFKVDKAKISMEANEGHDNHSVEKDFAAIKDQTSVSSNIKAAEIRNQIKMKLCFVVCKCCFVQYSRKILSK